MAGDPESVERRWLWRVEGQQVMSGTLRRGFEDRDVIVAESASDALVLLIERGPIWDNLDTEAAFTVTIEPLPPLT